MKYSKTIIEKVVTSSSGKKVMYSARPMGALNVAKEGFKLLKVVLPSIGAGIDSVVGHDEDLRFLGDKPYTLTTMFTMLSENISDDHFEDLQDKLLGSLMIGDKKIEDLDEYFNDNSGDYIEVLVWLFKENFGNFIMESAILRSKIASLMDLMNPEMKESIKKSWNALKTETE